MPHPSRRDWMGLLARAPSDRLAALLPDEPDAAFLRPPEIGTVMVQGRIGATGNAFNLGEMTVTRCVVRLADGRTGYSYLAGRDKRRAELAALADAHLQGSDQARWLDDLIEPLARQQREQRLARAARTATTQVEFFTLVRGED